MGKWIDLFSGGGMYSKGLEDNGNEIIGFCEVDKFCHRILKKHWPTKPISWSIELLNAALMELSADSRVKIFQSREKAKGFKGHPPLRPLPVQDCSGRWLKPICWFDLNTGLWKTWQNCLIEEWEPYLERWPPAGVMQNGIAWEREPLAHPIIAPESTFLPTIPTSEGKGSSRSRFKGSRNFRGAKMSEALRTCQSDPIYTHPNFAEAAMGLPKDYTLLETGTPPVLSGKSQKD